MIAASEVIPGLLASMRRKQLALECVRCAENAIRWSARKALSVDAETYTVRDYITQGYMRALRERVREIERLEQ